MRSAFPSFVSLKSAGSPPPRPQASVIYFQGRKSCRPLHTNAGIMRIDNYMGPLKAMSKFWRLCRLNSDCRMFALARLPYGHLLAKIVRNAGKHVIRHEWHDRLNRCMAIFQLSCSNNHQCITLAQCYVVPWRCICRLCDAFLRPFETRYLAFSLWGRCS